MRRFRRRARRPRKQAKLRLPGFTAAELGAKVGVSARTVRYYTAQHVLPAPQFRGSATRYLREHLIHLAAIRYLQREQHCSLDTIRRKLDPLPAAELERLASFLLPELTAQLPAAPPPPAPPPPASDAWHRLTLLPGLEIHLHAAASPDVRAIALRIVSEVRGA